MSEIEKKAVPGSETAVEKALVTVSGIGGVRDALALFGHCPGVAELLRLNPGAYADMGCTEIAELAPMLRKSGRLDEDV